MSGSISGFHETAHPADSGPMRSNGGESVGCGDGQFSHRYIQGRGKLKEEKDSRKVRQL